MNSAKGDALDWALALAGAPGERLVLRQRPLPDGIDTLLQIAAGTSGEALSGALARTGESEENLVEAVRFYLREVLFHSGADAYRVLGLERNASSDQAKAHHRWLQQWLHPDRHTSDWDAVFAGRVNAAWNQLRTVDRRRAYDAEHPVSPIISQGPALPAMATWVHEELPAQSPRQRWQRRVPLLALVAACMGLSVLALRDLARDEALVASADAGDVLQDGRLATGDAEVDAFNALRLPSREQPAAARKRAVKEKVGRAPELVRPDPGTRAALALRQPPRPPSTAAPLPQPRRPTAIEPAVPPVSTAAIARRVPPDIVSATRPDVSRTVEVPAVATPAAPVVAPATQVARTTISSEQVREAQRVGDRLLAFMQRSNASVPPIWDNLSVQQGATQLRGELLAAGPTVASPPDWTVAAREARMQVRIRYADGSGGRLNAGLVWREQRWLVGRLSMERDY